MKVSTSVQAGQRATTAPVQVPPVNVLESSQRTPTNAAAAAPVAAAGSSPNGSLASSKGAENAACSPASDGMEVESKLEMRVRRKRFDVYSLASLSVACHCVLIVALRRLLVAARRRSRSIQTPSRSVCFTRERLLLCFHVLDRSLQIPSCRLEIR
jgi:hypothetical protein